VKGIFKKMIVKMVDKGKRWAYAINRNDYYLKEDK